MRRPLALVALGLGLVLAGCATLDGAKRHCRASLRRSIIIEQDVTAVEAEAKMAAKPDLTKALIDECAAGARAHQNQALGAAAALGAFDVAPPPPATPIRCVTHGNVTRCD